ncbi:MAG: tyrosine recombinase XerC [Clostridia bacterium]|nr:tyrosine recombinase XerC [Clostridia bacterium]
MKQEILNEAPEVLKKFLGYLQTVKGKSAKTVEEYYIDLRTFFRYLKVHFGVVPKDAIFEEIKIDDVDTEMLRQVGLTDVFEYMNYLASVRDNHEAARARKASSLRHFFRYLTNKICELESNIIEELETPKLAKRLPKFLTLEQSKKLLNTVNTSGLKSKERDYCILTLFLNCGLRLSELAGININDFREDGTLRVIGKGNKERIVYLNAACKSAVQNYRKVRPNDELKDRKAFFISRQHNRISVKTVQALVKKYLQLSGLGGMGYSTHKLRHTAATLMYQHGGVDIRILKEILGHENINTTEIYTHISDYHVKNAIDANPLADINN